jgi:glycosyltransferase involved in cell wall biosynthesis
MKILWLAPFPYSSKTTHPAPWISSLAKELVQMKGIEITILNYSQDCKSEVEFQDYAPNIKLIFVRSPGLFIDLCTLGSLRIKRLKKQIKNCGPFNAIHIHGSEHQYEYCVSKNDTHVVMSIQGVLSEYLKYLEPAGSIKKYLSWYIYSRLELRGFKRVNNFSCRTNWDKAIVHAINPAAKIFTIWEVIRAEFTLSNKANKGEHIYFTGGSNPLKGLDIAVAAFAGFRKQVKYKGQLFVAGNVKKADYERIKKNVDESTFKAIKFTGIIGTPEIIAIQKSSFCHLHPSLIDNSPNSICESQLMGLPVIATPKGGVSSLVQNGITGLLAGDTDEIVSLLVRLYHDNTLWNDISRQSFQLASERHDRRTIVAETIQMYKQLVNS